MRTDMKRLIVVFFFFNFAKVHRKEIQYDGKNETRLRNWELFVV